MSEKNEKNSVANLKLVRVYFGNLEEFIKAYSLNIKQGGMFIRTPLELKKGERIKLEFKLRNNQPLIRGIAEILTVDKNGDADKSGGVAIRFIQLTPNSMKFIDEVMPKNKESKENLKDKIENLNEDIVDADVSEEIIEPDEIVEAPDEFIETVEEVIEEPEEFIDKTESAETLEFVDEVEDDAELSKEDDSGINETVTEEKDLSDKNDEILAPPDDKTEIADEVESNNFSIPQEKEPPKEEFFEAPSETVVEESEPITRNDEENIDQDVFVEGKVGNKNKIIIAVVIILIIAGIGGYFLFSGDSGNDEMQQITNNNDVETVEEEEENLPEEVVGEDDNLEVKDKSKDAVQTAQEQPGAESLENSEQKEQTVSLGPAKSIKSIAFNSNAVVITLDGKISKSKIKSLSLRKTKKDAARVVVKIKIPKKGIDDWKISGQGLVKQVRLGVHKPWIWIVIDFKGRRVPAHKITTEDDKIYISW